MFEEQRQEYAHYLQDVMREVREEAGLSQDDLAEKMSCSTQTIHRYESGKSIPPADALLLFAAITNTPLERFTPDFREAQNSLEEQTRFSLLSAENKKIVLATMNTLVNSLVSTQNTRIFTPKS